MLTAVACLPPPALTVLIDCLGLHKLLCLRRLQVMLDSKRDDYIYIYVYMAFRTMEDYFFFIFTSITSIKKQQSPIAINSPATSSQLFPAFGISSSCSILTSLLPYLQNNHIMSSNSTTNSIDDFQGCTAISPECPVEGTAYSYYPNLGANAFFTAIFALLLSIQLFQGCKWKTRSYMIALGLGCLGETIGTAAPLTSPLLALG